MADIVSFVVRLPGKPETSARLREQLMVVVEEMVKEKNFINTWVHEDLENPHTIVLYETWACSREVFIKEEFDRPYRQAYEAELPQLLAAPRTIEFLKIIKSFPGKRPAMD